MPLGQTATASPSGGAVVETHSLAKHYRSVRALDGCTMEVRRGEVFGLLGPNGAGKTTLLRLLMGYIHPTGGWARIEGFDCHHDTVRVRECVAYLPAEPQFFRAMRGRDVLRFFDAIRPGGDPLRSQQLASRLELDLARPVGQMSTGMRQKLGLVVSLASRTPLVVLDEPTANLDPSVRSEVLQLVREAKAAGQTVVFSSHVLSETEDVCDRVGILRAGRLVHTQVMTELRQRHRIRATLTGPLPPSPASIADQLVIQSQEDGRVAIETPGELSPLLGWLATLPLREVVIEPVGLRAVYQQFHGEPRS
ncbi:MAG: putative transporter ATP-binding protein YxlF [Planctomycetota bacterium]